MPSASSPPAWPPHRAVRRATASVSDGAGAGGPAATPRPAAGRGGQPAAAPLPAVGRLSSPALQRCTPPPLAVHFPSWWDWSCSLRCVVCTPLHASLRLRRIRHQGHPHLPTSPRALCMPPPPDDGGCWKWGSGCQGLWPVLIGVSLLGLRRTRCSPGG